MVLIDTGFLVGLASSRDELRSACLAWSAHGVKQLLLSEYVVVEFLNQMRSPTLRMNAAKLVTAYMHHPQCLYLPASPELFAAGFDLYRLRPDKAWSLTDCISFVVMRERGMTEALAYDQHFEQAGFRTLLREEPPGTSAQPA